jgi:hypothetical protein
VISPCGFFVILKYPAVFQAIGIERTISAGAIAATHRECGCSEICEALTGCDQTAMHAGSQVGA